MTTAWILSIYNLPSHYNCVSLGKALNRRNINPKFHILKRLSYIENKFYYDDAPVDAPDIIFSVNQYLQRVDIPNLNTRKLLDMEASGITITNKISSSFNASNKWLAFNILHANDIPTPFSILVDKNTKYDGSIIAKIGSPFVMKLLQGATGSKYSLCYTEEELKNEFDRLNRVYRIDQVIAQKYIEHTAGMIVTVGAVRDRCKRAVIRIGDPLLDQAFLGDTKANRTQIAYKVDRDLSLITDRVMTALDLDCARIDMMIDDNGYQILEANPPGGLNIIDLMHNSRIADEYVDRMLGYE